jgi:hypothetical protein
MHSQTYTTSNSFAGCSSGEQVITEDHSYDEKGRTNLKVKLSPTKLRKSVLRDLEMFCTSLLVSR